MRITTKITALIGMFALLLVGVAAFSFVQGWYDREQEARIDNAFEIAVLSANMSQAVERAVSSVDGVLLAQEDTDSRKAITELQGALGAVAAFKTDLFAIVGDYMSEAERAQLAAEVAEFVDYQTDTVNMAVKVSRKAAIVQIDDESTVANRASMLAVVKKLSDSTLASARDERAAAAAARQRRTVLVAVISLFTVLAGVMFGGYICEIHIRKPLDRLRKGVLDLAGGRLDVTFDDFPTQRRDRRDGRRRGQLP